MDHVAIMKKSWNLTKKILSKDKTIETRWYKNKYKPFNNIKEGETIYFKESGCLVTIKATVSKVEQFENLNLNTTKEIIKKYALKDLGTEIIPKKIEDYTSNKKYCIVVHLQNPEKVEPFNINKKGFGAMSSWICVKNIEDIKI